MANDTPIAVVGLSYRAPGIGRKGLWEYLAQAKSAWGKIPSNRFEQSAYYDAGRDRSGVFRTEGAHFVDDVYDFDAAFFNIRAEEAKHSDPQHRLMLEVALEAAEDAGHTLLDLAGKKIGVFVGSAQHEYIQRFGDDEHSIQTFSGTGSSPCMAANRISYFFDIDGPSVVTDAACASSIYAAHMAVSALRNGECNAAFIGAATLDLSPIGWLILDKTGALSQHGRSYSYDEKATGFGRGEGAACLLVKRIDDAIRDGDSIHAIIRSSACNHSGRSGGITMPSRLAQEKLLWAVHDAVGLDPSETPVVEGHGTGTAAGDPVETGAFTNVLAKHRTAANPIYLGSVKSNFGHLEGASGVFAIVKAIMMVKKGIVLPTAGFEKMNPKIEGRDRIKVATSPLPWPQGEPRRCVVTNFGFGGSNSAIILEEAPIRTAANYNGINGTNDANDVDGTPEWDRNDDRNGLNGQSNLNGNSVAAQTRRLFVFSAKTQRSLNAYLTSFNEYLDEVPKSSDFVKDLSYTLGQRRTQYPYRVSVVADSVASLQEKLFTLKTARIKDRTLAFVFTGQGAQYAQMASELDTYKIFTKAMEDAETHLQALGAHWSLTAELSKPASESRIHDAEISQPACTAVQLALVMLVKSWGVDPSVVTGHSSGEIAAAYAADLISFHEALAIAYFRGQAAARLARQQAHKGGMLALGVGFEEAIKLIEEHAGGYATVAAVNSPQSVTISGDQSAIANIHKASESKGLFARRLNVEMAYHSRHMEEVASFYLEDIKPHFKGNTSSVETKNITRPIFVSSVTGRVMDSVDVSYWIDNLVRPVLFANALQSLLSLREHGKTGQDLPQIVVEIGPHAALKNPIKQTVESIGLSSFTYLPSLLRGVAGSQAVLELAGSLFTLGTQLQLGAINQTDRNTAHVLHELPGYAWDKSTYELRPRRTHEKFFPGEPYHHLLGRRVSSNGGKERAYRQVFTLDEMPWIRDHVVAGATTFPMTGYMSCAIEAARRTLSTPAVAFLMTDFHVVRSLEIQEEQTVDMITSMKPAAIGEGTFSSKVWTFEISTWAEETGWIMHAWGQIEPEMADMALETPTFKASLPLVGTTANLLEHNVNETYESAGSRATRYGPTFRNMIRLCEGDGYTVLEHRLRDLGEALHDTLARGSPVTIDPPTLDGFFQGGDPLQVAETGSKRALMPNYFNRFRISNSIPSTPQQRFDVVMRRLDYDVKGGRMHLGVAVFARDIDGRLTPAAEWESVAFRSIGSAEENPDPASSVPDHWAWEMLPRFDFMSRAQLKGWLLEEIGDLGGEEAVRNRKFVEAGCYYIDRALKEMAGDDLSKLPQHLSRFAHWGAQVVAEHNLEFSTEPTELLDYVRGLDAQGELLCIMGEQLLPVLRGEVGPLEIMLTDGRLTRHYESDVINAHLSRVLGCLVDKLADLEPNQCILEVGGGTAGTTFPVLEGLSRGREEPGFLNYTFTDISSGFFEMAREKLSKWSQRIIYKKLDITQDPVEQGFSLQDYDVVIAANVLHATADMVATMTHGPMMSVSVWDQLLRDTGFSGVDNSIPCSWTDAEPLMNIMCSSRVGKQDERGRITVCGPFMDDIEVEFAQSVADSISKHLSSPVELTPLSKIDPEDDPYYVFIDSAHRSVLQDVTPDRFEGLKALLLRNKGLLWVVPEGASPDARIIRGLLRTLRLEGDLKNLILLEDVPSTPEGSSGILKLAERLRDTEIARDQDRDMVWNDDSIRLPRLRQLQEVKEQFAVEEGIYPRKLQNMWEGDRALEMTIDAAGSPDTIYFHRTDAAQQPLGEDDILVQVEAAGVSYRDLDVVIGSIPWAPPGYDGAGKVIKTGSKVTNLQEGDNVLFLALEGSAFATYKKMSSWHSIKVPSGMSITDAASLPLAYSLAVLALSHTARLKRDETVLIHAAAGAVGQACVVVAQHLGAHIFATAGTEDKRDLLHHAFGIPKDHIFSSRTPEFRDSILCATGGKGVDVIVNSLNGELMTETWALAAPFGYFIELGKKDAFQNNNLPMKPFDNNVTFSSVDLRDLHKHRPEAVKDLFREVGVLLERNVAVPTQPVTTFPISQFAAALRRLRSGEAMGKMVVTLGADESVMAESSLRPTQAKLNPRSTYLVAGGTRGIGLDLAYWMIGHGARYIVLLGRSGSSGPDVQKMLHKYRDTDVCVRAYACNVGNRTEIAGALESIRDLPPIRGVVQSALQLSDKMFANSTYEDWKIITTPRVQGAWNLHELMPADLDFFVVLSSYNGDSGNMGQAIYSGTTGFYDGFAQYRNARGQYTVSIALPVVLDVGYVADNKLSDILKQTMGATITMADIRAIFQGILMGPTSPFVHNGRTTALKLYIGGQEVQDGSWRYLHPALAKERLKNEWRSRGKAGAVGGVNRAAASWRAAEDPLVGLTEALITKVSAMTMIERDEVLPDTSLAFYSLDSLVSVELRNWIRRETTVELTLGVITQAASLKALASDILAQRK